MELRDLRCFIAVAECGTLSKAAARLRLAQPALSRKIQKMEHELGVQLLRRTPRGVVPTEAGQVLLERAIKFEQDVDEMRREMARYAERLTGLLKVAIQSPLSLMMAPQLLRTYQSAHPGVRLELTEGFSGDLVDGLLNGKIDIAIADTPSHAHADLTYTQLWVETLQFACAAGRLAELQAGKTFMTLVQLADLPIIMPAQRHAIRRLVDAAFQRHQLRFEPAIEANGALMIMQLVSEGLGYTIMPQNGLMPWVTSGELEASDLRPPIRRTISVITKASLLDDPRVRVLRNVILDLTPNIIGKQGYSRAAIYSPHGLSPPATMPSRHGTQPRTALVSAEEKS